MTAGEYCVVCGKFRFGGHQIFGRPLCSEHYIKHIDSMKNHAWDRLWAENASNKKMVRGSGHVCKACGYEINKPIDSDHHWELGEGGYLHLTKAECEVEIVEHYGLRRRHG